MEDQVQRMVSAEMELLASPSPTQASPSPTQDEQYNALHGPQGQDVHEVGVGAFRMGGRGEL